MASLTTALLLLLLLVGVFTISATARPCKTIFFITSSSSSYYYPADIHHLGNPNFAIQNPSNSPRLTFFITEIHQFHRTRSFPRPLFNDRAVEDDVVASKPYYSPASSSIRDRTMDIMSIVGALLFGVGCGALTAATMYLIWSLFSNRRLDFGSDSDEEEEEEDYDDDVTPRKNGGYAAIPPAATKAVPPTADEVEAMK